MLYNVSVIAVYQKCHCSNIRTINNLDQSEMEQKGKYNKKTGFRNFLFPTRTSNKVGVAISRSQSAKENDQNTEVAILKRPLSFNNKFKRMSDHQLTVPGVSINISFSATIIFFALFQELCRKNSLSDTNIFLEQNDDSDKSKLEERTSSHESIFNLREGNVGKGK